MPIYGEARLVAVPMPGAANLLYGFNTKVDTADSSALGHVSLETGNPTNIVLFGCNSRKPKRAKKTKATGEQNSSYVSDASVAAAKAAGWEITSSRVTLYKDTSRSVRMKAKLGAGVFVGWKMPNATALKIAGAPSVANGIVAVQDGDDNVFYGVNSVMFTDGTKITRKQLKGKVPYEEGGVTKNVTTYVAYDKTPD